jgi:hypothetical protein
MFFPGPPGGRMKRKIGDFCLPSQFTSGRKNVKLYGAKKGALTGPTFEK